MNFGNRKKPVWLVLLFFLSTGGGVAVFFIWKSLPSLANPPDLRLYSAIRNAKTAFELAEESMPEEKAAQKPDPFKQPGAYFKDDSKSASGGHGSPGEYQAPGKTGRPSRMGTKLASRFRKPSMRGRLKRGIRSSKGSSTSGRSVSSFKKTAGDKLATVSKTLVSTKKDSPLVGALASLKRTSEHVGAGAVLSSGDRAKYRADLGYAEAQAGQKELSYGENLAKLDTIKTEVKDLKMQASRTLTAPDPGLPTGDKSAEAKDSVLNKLKDIAKKAANPITAPPNQLFPPLGSSPPPSDGEDKGFGLASVDEPYDIKDGIKWLKEGDTKEELNAMGYYPVETSDDRWFMYDGVTNQWEQFDMPLDSPLYWGGQPLNELVP